MKQLEVQIMGQSYLLGCPPDGDSRLLDAVSRVDLAMCKIRDSGKIKARDRIAVLAALNLAFDTPEQTAKVKLPASPSQDSEQLSALLQRLDHVLGQDGQLL